MWGIKAKSCRPSPMSLLEGTPDTFQRLVKTLNFFQCWSKFSAYVNDTEGYCWGFWGCLLDSALWRVVKGDSSS